MMKKEVDVSVIMVNYCSCKLLKNAIDSIIKKTKNCIYEIIIIDNNSPDNSILEIQEQYRFINFVRIIKLDNNLGFGKANNIGAEYCRGEYLFFLNPDTILVNDAISILLEYLKSKPQIGAIGGNLYTIDMRPNHSYRRVLPSIFYELSSMLYHIPERLLYGKNAFFNCTNNVLDVAYVSGADLMIKKEVFNQVKGFNPLFFMYYEETELCRRIRQIGYKIVSVPQAKIIHLEGRSSSNMERKAMMVGKSRNIYYSICHTYKYKIISDTFFLFNCLCRMCYGILFDHSYYIYWKTMVKFLYKK